MLRLSIWICIGLVFAVTCTGAYIIDRKVLSEQSSGDSSDAALSLAETEVVLLRIASRALAAFAVGWVWYEKQ
jgi:hypothetical protein